MSAVLEPIAFRVAEPDLIDRIANALPAGVRAEYYRELRHCRSLPENDEMLRLLRAMQFLVLLIEQAPSRVADERERLDVVLASAIESFTRVGESSDAYHTALQMKLTALPSEIASGINPSLVAGKISEMLGHEFARSGIPKTAHALGEISEQMKRVSTEFAVTSDQLGSRYRGAAEEAKLAVASLKDEIFLASNAAARFTKEIAERSADSWRWSLYMVAAGALVVGLGFGMTFERWLLSSELVAAPVATVVQSSAPEPTQTAPDAPRLRARK